ncbi:MAG: glycosyltransferase family 2 protein [Desulfuromonadaceae bacterium]|nr:glycosyltransferase family 2 protein [Desulfuromonadaceae bacterium]MDD2855769.1 glycosyltransferase family 2 protein [Desulfuromonadaceae bacterium]
MTTININLASQVLSIQDLSIIIPAYNEQENIRLAVDQVLSGLPAGLQQFEIIIVNDGSTDATSEIISELTSEHSSVRSIIQNGNKGKGAALSSGFSAARHEWILFIDADLQIEFSVLEEFVPYMKTFDIIIGFRTTRDDSLYRRFASRVYSLLIRLLLGLKLADINCPFKLFRRKLLDGIDLRSSGFFIDTELMYHFLQRKYPVKEVGVVSFDRTRGNSSVRLRHVRHVLAELFTLLKRKQ